MKLAYEDLFPLLEVQTASAAESYFQNSWKQSGPFKGRAYFQTLRESLSNSSQD